MTREEIEQMPAGPEMDYLIATEIFKARRVPLEQLEMIRVMQFQFGHFNPSGQWLSTLLIEPLLERNECTGADWMFTQARSYSTDIAAAWLVVEKMRESGWRFSIGDNVGGESVASFWTHKPILFTARAGIAPLAICRAALIATLE